MQKILENSEKDYKRLTTSIIAMLDLNKNSF